MPEDNKPTHIRLLEAMAEKYKDHPEGTNIFMVIDNRQGSFTTESNTNDMVWALGILKMLEMHATIAFQSANQSGAAFFNMPIDQSRKVN